MIIAFVIMFSIAAGIMASAGGYGYALAAIYAVGAIYFFVEGLRHGWNH